MAPIQAQAPRALRQLRDREMTDVHAEREDGAAVEQNDGAALFTIRRLETPPSSPAPSAHRCAAAVSSSQRTVRPVLVVVLATRSTTTRRLVSGVARQVCVMWQNMRCSILFHFDVPGG